MIHRKLRHINSLPIQTGSTLLYQASFMGNTDEVKELLEGGADVNEQNDVNSYQVLNPEIF